MNQSEKFLINLQFGPHDKQMMMSLAMLMADLQVGEPHADILFSPRFDTDVDLAVMAAVSKKFGVTVRKTEIRAKGWPAGCNAMALDTYNWFADQCEYGDMEYYAIFMGESDCIPLSPNWIKQLHDEWHKCDWGWHLSNKQLVLGPWVSKIEARIAHINGNCMISPKFRNVCPNFNYVGCPGGWGWDAYFADQMMRFGRPSKLIYSDYHLDTPRNPWPIGAGCEHFYKHRHFAADNPLHGVSVDIAYLHGIKTMRGQECIRKKFLKTS